ncbi:MAG: DNA polymerase III subunit alpha [Candidatus Aquicultor sp.]
MSNFIHLHTHSEYSLLDGASRLKDLVAKAKELGMPAIALTDHGVMYGIIEFYEQAKKQGIKPIIGCEVYVAPGSRFDKTRSDESYTHLVLLAENDQGYRNLMKLVMLSFFDGFYYKPRVDKEILEQYHEGLIASSACLAGQVARHLMHDNYEAAKKEALYFETLFGKGNFYLEVQDHGIPEQKKVNEGMFRLSEEIDIPIIATNDIHYTNREDAPAHDVLLCIQTGSTLADTTRMRFDSDNFYLKSGEEMAALFPGRPDVLENTAAIAERCNVEIKFGEYLLPNYDIPEGYTADEYFEKLCHEGFEMRYPEASEQYKERLEYEIGVIKQMGFPGYFLVVQDFVRYAKSQDIKVGPGRGSAAGSMVAYCLEITNVDPMKYDLLFERFLNPERISMPDIDIDFCFERRPEVIEYVTQKYGEDKVAQIITFGTMAARAAIRDAGRVFDIPYGRVDKIAKMIPEGFNEGRPWTIDAAIQHVPELKDAYQNDQEVTGQVLDMAKNLEGLVRQDSIHAAGVVISDQELTNRTPVQRKGEAEIVTQYSMGSIEKIGLLKMDFLGLRTLTVIDNAVKNIKKNHGVEIDIDTIPDEDKKTYDLLQKGETTGVFQLESSGMRSLLRDLQPTAFTDIIALLALYRPGPLGSGMVKDFVERKHGQKPISYPHEMLEPVLKETYGVMVYQEQVMRIASTMGGFSMGQADTLRKAMGKKLPEVLAKLRQQFVEGSVENGVEEGLAGKVFDLIVHFAGYGFNKCVIGSTEIVDADTGEIVTVEELYTSRRNISTLSCDNDYKIVKRPVVDCVSNGHKPVFRVATQSGHTITATDNHPFLTMDGWKELRELGVGKEIAAATIAPSFFHTNWPKHNAYYELVDDKASHDVAQCAVRTLVKQEEITADIYWDKIVSIEPMGVEQTYDLEIEGTHSFIANGLIVHNSHSTAYAVVSWQTAWLKAHYPVEFLAALLTSIMGNKDKVAQYINECRRMNVEILPPDVNESYRDFTVVGNSIRFGLSAVRNVGEGAIEGIISEREHGGQFKSIYDFCRRVDMGVLNKRTIESLIKGGAFDTCKVSRKQLLLTFEKAVDMGIRSQKDKAA